MNREISFKRSVFIQQARSLSTIIRQNNTTSCTFDGNGKRLQEVYKLISRRLIRSKMTEQQQRVSFTEEELDESIINYCDGFSSILSPLSSPKRIQSKHPKDEYHIPLDGIYFSSSTFDWDDADEEALANDADFSKATFRKQPKRYHFSPPFQ